MTFFIEVVPALNRENVFLGTSQSVGMPNFGRDSPTSTGSMPNYPPGKLASPFGMGGNQMSGSGATSSSLPSASAGGSIFSSTGAGVGGPAAAAAAAVLEAVNTGARFPGSSQVPGQPYVTPQEMMLSGKASESVTPSGLSPMQLGPMMVNVQTGLDCPSCYGIFYSAFVGPL